MRRQVCLRCCFRNKLLGCSISQRALAVEDVSFRHGMVNLLVGPLQRPRRTRLRLNQAVQRDDLAVHLKEPLLQGAARPRLRKELSRVRPVSLSPVFSQARDWVKVDSGSRRLPPSLLDKSPVPSAVGLGARTRGPLGRPSARGRARRPLCEFGGAPKNLPSAGMHPRPVA